MNQEIARHEKIRFRRSDICGLHTFPSACAQEVPRGFRRRLRATLGLAAGLACLLAVLVGGAYLAANSSFASERLRDEAQAAISRLSGSEVFARIGDTGISLDGMMTVALDLRDVGIGDGQTGRPLLEAERLSLGLGLMPMISGRIGVRSARIADARIDLAAIAASPAGLPPGILDPDGVIDPDAVIGLVFSTVESTLAALDASDTHRLELENVEIVADSALPARWHILHAAVKRQKEGTAAITGRIRAGGRELEFSGRMSGSALGAAPVSFEIALQADAPEVGGDDGAAAKDAAGQAPPLELGAFALDLAGTAGGAQRPRALTARLKLEDAALRVGRRAPVAFRGVLDATLGEGTDKIEFDRLQVVAGRSRLNFTGAIGRIPTGEGIEPGYRFELLSRGSLIAPADSPEPALAARFVLGGRIDRDFRGVIADELGVATSGGEAIGSGSLQFAAGRTPGASLALAVGRMPVSHVKNLWPWFAAPGAREWALHNVFGGRVENSRLLLTAPPGSFVPGRHLNEEEISGRFEVRGTRFDVTGAIPPVRDANGTIAFQGMDLDIALSSGTVFMRSGRTLAAKDGTLSIRDAHLKPLVGQLDIALDGGADAVVEFAGYDPINVSRFMEMAPQDISGKVAGRVKALVPLSRGIPLSDLDWEVSLAYEDLAIAEPFMGQDVTGAEGTIVATPASATIEAEARLNGSPAAISLFEPLGPDKSQRRRNLRLQLDDGQRDALLPQLSGIVSGPLSVDLSMNGEQGNQRLVADLGRAHLSLPWIGWSKGAGVPATVSFLLERAEGTTRISDFVLRGESFGAEGSFLLDAGGLASGRLSRLALNRGDDAEARIERRSGRYHVEVGGSAFDARPIIKAVRAPREEGDAAAAPRLALDLSFASLAGFHGETLTDVRVVYSGSEEGTDGLRASARTGSGAHVAVVDAEAGGNRRIEMQAGDAGAVLRFLDIYGNISGGRIALSLSGTGDGPLRGHVEAHDFIIANEARLASIVGAPSDEAGPRNAVARSGVDVSRAHFDQGFALLEKGTSYLSVSEGVVRGSAIGSTFQGTVFDGNGDMNITGTFMPAYGLNRIFGEIPLIGQILGNRRDRGLIGITFRLTGKTGEPRLEVNPLSIVAPGIFRSIFEYR